MRIERQHHGREPLLCGQAGGLRQHGAVTAMHAIEIADGDQGGTWGP
jgi:hypothetical protein